MRSLERAHIELCHLVTLFNRGKRTLDNTDDAWMVYNLRTFLTAIRDHIRAFENEISALEIVITEIKSN